MTRFPRYLRYTLKAILLVLLLLGLFIGGIFFFLSTAPGKLFVTNELNTALKSKVFSVNIQSINSFYPFSISLDDLVLSHDSVKSDENPDGRWVTLQGAQLTISVEHVFSNKQRKLITDLEVDQILLIELPQNPPENEKIKEAKPIDFGHIKGKLEDRLPINFNISVSLHKIFIGEYLIGKDVIVSAPELTLTYDKNTHEISGDTPLRTTSFGSPLLFHLKFNGPLDNIDTQLKLETKTFKYNDLIIDDIDVNAVVEGFPKTFRNKLSGTFSYQGVKGDLKLEALELKGDVLEVSGLKFKGLNSDISGSATYDISSAEFNGDIRGVIQNLSAFSALMDMPLKGSGSFAAKVQMQGENPSVIANLALKNLETDSIKVDALTAKVDIPVLTLSPTAKVDIKAQAATIDGIELETVSVNGQLDKGHGPISMRATGEDVNLVFEAKTALGLEKQQIVINTLAVNYLKQPIKMTKPSTLTIENETYSFTPLNLQVVSFPLTISGKYAENNLDMAVKAFADLGVISKLFLYTGDIIEGQLSADLKITGTPENPAVDGFLKLDNGDYENIVWGTKLHDLDLKAVAKNNKIILENVKANDGHGGHIAINGYYDYVAKLLDVNFKIVDMRLAYNDDLHIEGREGDIKITGPIDELKLEGSLKTGDIYYNIASQYGGNIPELNVVDPEKPKTNLLTGEKKQKKKKTEKELLTFDLDIDIPSTVEISGMGLTSVWGGELKITGPLSKLLILGNIDASEGSIVFVGKDIEIEEGALRFDGHANNIPYLSLVAGLERQDFKAIISVNGRANKPTFTLSSEPSMPQDEILAQLIFDTKSKQLSPFDAVKIAKVAADLGGLTSGASLSSVLKNNVDPKKEADDKDKKDLKSDKRFSDFVKIHYDQGVNPKDGKVTVEVDVSPRVTVKSETSVGDSSQSLGVQYSWDY